MDSCGFPVLGGVWETLPHTSKSSQLVWSSKKIWHLAKLRNPQTNFPHKCSHHMDERPGLVVRDNRHHIPGSLIWEPVCKSLASNSLPILYFSHGLFLSLTKGSLTTIIGEANIATTAAVRGLFGAFSAGPSRTGKPDTLSHLNRSNQQEGGQQVTN